MCSRASLESRVHPRSSCCSHVTQQMGISKTGSTWTFSLPSLLKVPPEGATDVGSHSQGALGECGLLVHFPAPGSCCALLQPIWGVISVLCNCGRMLSPHTPSCFDLECGQKLNGQCPICNLSGWIERGPMCCFGVELC